MAKIRKARNGNGYDVCTALPNDGWDIVTAPTMEDALRLAGMEPEIRTERFTAECDGEDEDFSDLAELLWGDA